MENTDLKIFTGDITRVTLPSGKVVLIRETNGADDELLSTLEDITSGDNFNLFITSIVMEDEDLGRKPLLEEVIDWKEQDRWFLIVKQRIINKGDKLDINYTCPIKSCGKKSNHTEELLPALDLVKGYPNGKESQVKAVLSSGKTIKFDILTGRHVKKELDLPQGRANKNTAILLRNLILVDPTSQKEIPILHFGIFKSSEMSEIRKLIKQYDPEYNPLAEIECPHCKHQEMASIFGIPDFFWPGE